MSRVCATSWRVRVRVRVRVCVSLPLPSSYTPSHLPPPPSLSLPLPLPPVCDVCTIRVDASSSPYPIVVGGSNAIGSWGYIEAARELMEQCRTQGVEPTDLCVACGSGGTCGGLAVGVFLSGWSVKVHGFCVSDTVDHHYGCVSRTSIDALETPRAPHPPVARCVQRD
jgi:hypothetical protein